MLKLPFVSYVLPLNALKFKAAVSISRRCFSRVKRRQLSRYSAERPAASSHIRIESESRGADGEDEVGGDAV